jgi:hypothetical protein
MDEERLVSIARNKRIPGQPGKAIQWQPLNLKEVSSVCHGPPVTA